jgi:hypothetical protein
MRATEIRPPIVYFKPLSSVSRTCYRLCGQIPALKRWTIFAPSAIANDSPLSALGRGCFVTASLLFVCALTVFGQQNSNPVSEHKEASPAVKEVTITSESNDAALAKKTGSGSKNNWRPQPDSDDDSWHFEVSPYIWAAALKGDLRVRDTTANVDASFSDIFHNLDFSFATAAEAIKGKWRVLIDENYINLGTTGTGPLGEPTDIQPTLNFFEVGASYAPVIIPNKDSTANEPLPPIFSLEAIGGLRYTHFGLELARAGNPGVEGSRNLVDFFGGGRFKIRPHPKFTLIEKFTLGGGGSNFAWTFTSLGDYRFRKCLSAWGGYQVLSMDSDDPSNIIGFDGQLRGLIFGVTIHK